MNNKFLFLVISLVFLFITSNEIYTQCLEKEKSYQLGKVNSTLSKTKLNINLISTWIENDGICDFDFNELNAGFEYPKGSNKTLIFTTGLIWGGKVNGEVRVNGSYYNSGLQPGRILENGIPEDPNSASARIYRVIPDYMTNSLDIDYYDGMGSGQEIWSSYDRDWYQWPWAYGAPFDDLNKNNSYNPTFDIPGEPGTHQTIWFAANDLDSNKCKNFAGSNPIGIEMQATFYAYSTYTYLSNIIFKKYKLINKSGSNIENMYLNLTADIDVGYAADDFAGCDTTLSLGFGFNADNEDEEYGATPPAVGILLLQGPAIKGNENDVAYQNRKKIYGYKNMAMTSFSHFYCGDSTYRPPWTGDNYNNGTLGWYNIFEGKQANTGEPFKLPNELGGGITKFTFSGDPITGKGWVDGKDERCGDRYFNVVTGPFNLAIGDTQEVIYAQIAADGVDRLDAVKNLKQMSSQLINDFKDSLYAKVIIPYKEIPVNILEDRIPSDYNLHQNYPNPFNPSTQIIFELPTSENIKLEVFNILGEKVKELVNEFREAGKYQINFDANSLASGVYIYRLTAGTFSKNCKMLLLK